ncbi:NAD(P)/FAD-dependent oxidoreductase [Castellaniella sp.]|uniref:NAD(P)/FAD-dependent oxidoreductase n=1 Tax=Castellaniella sp. TaxID=1955812 RepID=UPI00356A6D70
MTANSIAADIVVMGGGVVGSATAYFIKHLNPASVVTVVEPDPTYEYASSTLSSGGCRVQFTAPENIDMSLYSIDFIKTFPDRMRTAHHEAHVDWVEGGYLFIVPAEVADQLERNVQHQVARGAVVDLLDQKALKETFPAMHVDDLALGAHSPHDGWCDPNGLLWGFRHKAEALGAVYLGSKVVGADVGASRIRSIQLQDGTRIRADAYVNATGAWSGEVARLFGMHLPISPMRRFEHYFTAGSAIGPLPYVKDLARLAFRSEGPGYSGGLVDGSETRGFNFDVDHGYFERTVWPALAHRFPAFEATRCHRTWAGLYEVNELDGNPVIGAWNTRLPDLYTVAGFSGHGMMHAPAAAMAVAELITYGEYRTLDLSRLGYERVERSAPYPELGIL